MADSQSTTVGPWSRPIRILMMSVWFGIVAAWAELGILAWRKYVQNRPSFGLPDRVSLLSDYRNFWTVPLAESLTLLVPALLFALVARRWPGARTWFAAVTAFAALTVTTILFNYTWLHPVAVIALASGIGTQIGRLATTHADGFGRLVRGTLAWMIATVAVSGVGATAWHARSERTNVAQGAVTADAPNVLLIILDTVRSFNLSTYGYNRETTPNLSRLAARGVLFDRAYATAPWTLPSHASIFTGRLPNELSGDMQSSLDMTWPTLAETMGAHGYATAGFVANLGYCSAETGLARGFSHYEDRVLTRGSLVNSSAILRIATSVPQIARLVGYNARADQKDADRINSDFLHWLPSTNGRPFFVFLNYYDAHRPYTPHGQYDSTFLVKRRQLTRLLQNTAHQKKGLPPEASALLTNAYDGSIAYLDNRVGWLIDELERRGTLRNTVVIITSDHGEQFGEHGLFFHANSLYTQLLRVPLLILGTGRVPTGSRIATPVTLRDLAPTVLDLAGRGGPGPFPGRSLSRLWAPGAIAGADSTPLGAELGEGAQLIEDFATRLVEMRAVVSNGMHYVRGLKDKRTGEVVEELYDLEADSLELHDLSNTEIGRQRLGPLRATLDSMVPLNLKTKGIASSPGVPVARPSAKPARLPE